MDVIVYFSVGTILSIITLIFYGLKGFNLASPYGSDFEYYTVGAAIGIAVLLLWPLLTIVGANIFFLSNFRRKQKEK